MKTRISLHFLMAAFVAVVFSACGSSSSGPSENAEEQESSASKETGTLEDLGKCRASNEGKVRFVEEEGMEFICEDGEWVPVEDDPPQSGDSKKSSSSGKKTDSSASENPSGNSSGSSSGSSSDSGTSSPASSAVEISSSSTPGTNDSIPTKPISKAFSGVAEKGPFVSGSTMKIWEMDDELSLTGTKFEWEVSTSLGEYSSPKVNLTTQYALLQATGAFYNEVSGTSATGDFTLKGLVNLDGRDKVNLNILSHLSYNRAMALYASGDYKNVPAAKAKAEQEVMSAFYMNSSDSPLRHSFEDLSIFGSSDDDAKLLAISILLTRTLNVTGLTSTLAELSADFKDDGKWNGSVSSTSQVTIADWAFNIRANFSKYRTNLQALKTPVPDFEKWIYRFIESVYSIPCNEKLDGNMEQVAVVGSQFNGKTLVCDGGKLRVMSTLDSLIGYACTATRDGAIKSYTSYSTEYTKICDSGSWRDIGIYDYSKEDFFSETANYGTLKDSRDNKTYKTIKIGSQTWMAENLNYSDSVKTPLLAGNSWCFNNRAKNCEMAGRLYTWTAAMNLAEFYLEESAADVIAENHQGICPSGWHIPTSSEWNDLMEYVEALGLEGYAGRDLKSQTGWSYYSAAIPTDEYGFSAIPTGAYYGMYAETGNTYSAYTFDDEGYFTNFWSASEAAGTYSATRAIYWFLDYRYDYFKKSVDYNQKGRGFAVRCLKN